MHELEKRMREVQNEAFLEQMANTTVTVFRPSSFDEYEGTFSETLVKSDLTALIIEETRVVEDPASTTPRIVRFLTCRLYTEVDVRADDRLKDDNTGTMYAIQAFRQHKNPLSMQGLIMDIVRVGHNNP